MKETTTTQRWKVAQSLRSKLVAQPRSRRTIGAIAAFSDEGDKQSIDFQSDTLSFGRGEMHLSAVLSEGDTVVYQNGTWEVDGVEVGNGEPPCVRFCKTDSLQVVWTHNCEHGFIRGFDLILGDDRKTVSMSSDFIEFGPEQLLARLPVEWSTDERGFLLSPLPPILSTEI
jgi:hypothetical protein